MGDPHFSPLEEVLELYLQQTVGDVYWQKAQDLRRAYLERKCLVRRSQPVNWITVIKIHSV